MGAELFVPLKVMHIVSVIVAVGANVTYQAWLAFAGRDSTRLVFAIEGIRRIDRRLASPAYALVLITGILMVLTGQYPFDAGWIRAALLLYILVALVGIAVFAPAIRRQLALAKTAPTSDEYEALARRTSLLGWFTTFVVFVIVWLMVVKPF
ncbi:MAG TPA: DUF2269 family protein [Candidatus Dormibacteraeota bacterium]|nr:DUF2269 family protein [Candidatus Dormibacteraeota bacterium]